METFILPVVLAALGSSGLSAVVLAILQRKWKREDDENDKYKKMVTQEEHQSVMNKISELSNGIVALTTAQKVSMVERINYLCICYITAKEISLADKKIVNDMHDAYKGLGGNGDLNLVMSEVNKLPIVSGYRRHSKVDADANDLADRISKHEASSSLELNSIGLGGDHVD